MQHLLAIEDLTPEEVLGILALAENVKANQTEYASALHNVRIVHLYSKPSTRTKGSFDMAMHSLGGSAFAMDFSTSNFDVNDPDSIMDETRSLSVMGYKAIAARVYQHSVLKHMAQTKLGVPIINALSDLEHPCQGLADLLTIQEVAGHLEGITIAYVGDGTNVCNSLISGAYKTGMNIRVATPDIPKYKPDAAIMRNAGSSLLWTPDPHEAVRGAQFVYTDTWTSLGQEAEKAERNEVFPPYQVNAALMPPGAYFMHCLPAHRGLEVTGDIIDGSSSLIYKQAENRLHAQKAILLKLIEPSLYQ